MPTEHLQSRLAIAEKWLSGYSYSDVQNWMVMPMCFQMEVIGLDEAEHALVVGTMRKVKGMNWDQVHADPDLECRQYGGLPDRYSIKLSESRRVAVAKWHGRIVFLAIVR